MYPKKLKAPKELQEKIDKAIEEGTLVDVDWEDLNLVEESVVEKIWNKRPYWIPSWFRIKAFWRQQINFIKNTYKFRSFLAHNYDFDFDSIYEIIELKAQHLESIFLDGSWDMYAEQKAKQLKITRNLAKRLRADDYIYMTNDIRHAAYLYEQDRKMLFDIISKNIHGWWD